MSTKRRSWFPSFHPHSVRRRGRFADRLLLERLETRTVLDAGLVTVLDDFVSVHQNGPPAPLDVLANDVFAAEYTGARQITSVSYGSQGGSIEIADDRRSLLYAPPADFEGSESFIYVIDGQFTGTVQVSIRSPLAADEYVVSPDGGTTRLELLGNDPFWGGYAGPREITSVSASSAGGTVEISADRRAVMYTPPEDAFDRDSFVYIVDGRYPSRVTISIPRPLRQDEYELVQNTPGSFAVLANDPFWPGYSGARRITHVRQDSLQGTIEIAADGQTLLYTPEPSFSGWASFSYVVDSAYEEHVTLVVHRPVRDDAFEVDQNSTEHVFSVLRNDTYEDRNNRTRDVVERVTSVAAAASGGTVTVSSDGLGVVYTPPQGFAGVDTFTYVADGRFEAQVSVSVTRPVRDDSFAQAVYQDTPGAKLDVLANDFLGNGYTGPRQITGVSSAQNGGQVAVAADGRSITYSPASGYAGQDSFTYTVDESLTATATVWVVPLAQGDHYGFCPDPAQVPYVLDVVTNDHFGRGYAGPGVITGASAPEHGGSVRIDGGRRLLYTPGPAGWDTFGYTVDGRYEAAVSVSLHNHLVGDSYVIDQNSPSGRLDVLANDFQYYQWATCSSTSYRGPRQITAIGGSEEGGTVTIAADGQSLQYEPPTDFHGQDQFTYTVDGLMQTTVSVNVIRRVRDDQFRVDSAGGESLSVLVNDLFGADYRGKREITSVSGSAAGASVIVAADGKSVHYTPAAGFVGTDTFTYTVDSRLKAQVRVVVEASRDDEFPRFDTLAEYQQFLIDDALVRYAHLFGQSAWFYGGNAGGDNSGFPFDLGGAPPESDRTHSETNVQVEGVDEGDIVEFDSDYVYILTGSELVIADAWPAEELSIASRVDLEGTPIAEFLKGDRLTVISQVGGGHYPYPLLDFAGPRPFFDFGIWPPYPPEPATTIITVFDVTDRAAPSVVQTTSMEGSYVQSRAIGDYVYALVRNDDAVAPPPLVITQDDPPPEEEDECGAENPIFVPRSGPSGVYETKEEYLARITANPGDLVDAALPNYSSYDRDGDLVRTGLVTDPEGILRPLLAGVSNLINVVSLNVTGDEPGLAASAGVYATGGGTVYASLDNFYVFDNDYSAEDGATTRVMKFDWDAATGGVEFAATTAVPGSMVNQFSADEHDGYLRIATTISNQGSGNFSGRTENALFVLAEDEGVFEFTGSMQNLALGETIQSVRFMDERAMVVTFRVIDPLFGIDLADPANPRSVGHLTLPGFSSYMQFISDTHLLTVGKNTPGGAWGPTQVSLFDVSDLAAPRLVDQYTFERFSTSEAELDHRAFGYFAEHGLLAIPTSRGYVERTDEDGDGYRETRAWVNEQQLSVLAIDLAHAGAAEDGIRWLAEIEHAGQVRRSGYIGDRLYSIATDSVKAVAVADPGTVVGELAVPVEEPADPPVVPVDPEQCPPAIDAGVVRFPAAVSDGPLALAVERAQQHLAGYLGVDAGASLVVAAEEAHSPFGGFEIVLRAADRLYLYRAQSNGSVALVDSDFTLDDEPGDNLRHGIDPPRFAPPTVPVAAASLAGRSRLGRARA